MARKRKRQKTEAQLEWERGFEARQRNLRELAEGRAEREWRAAQAQEKKSA